jgi:hypothetical protein
MTTEPQDDQNFELSGALRTMGEPLAPPAWLEHRIIGVLQERRLLRRPSRMLRAALITAACVACFATGLLLPRLKFQSRSVRVQPQYVLLLFQGAGMPASDSKEEAVLVQEYSRWAGKERSAGHLIGGEKLNDTSVEIGGSRERQTSKTDNQLVGYFVITAPDLPAALTIARTCPHLAHGGSIVLRPIDPTSSQ